MSEPPTGTDDQRLIEDYLPIEAISTESSREKSTRKGHISTIHLWWARRPLVACRAAVYGALVPASQFIPNGAQTDEKKKSLGRANAAKFVKALCQYPSSPHFISEAQHHILKAHAERLTREIADWKTGNAANPAWLEEFKFSGERVGVQDIIAGRAPRPRVLDMFAGGGAIPLEALRLGCEAYALDLNPVAYIIELCTLVYPQKYGKPDPNARGMTGSKNTKGETTWGGLAEEVRYWGEWVMRKVKAEIGDLYPLMPDPEFKGKRPQIQTDWIKDHDDVPPGYLMPVAYLWTRTVQCKNPACKASVPLVKQTWLARKPGRYAALKVVQGPDKRAKFEVVLARSEAALGFDPSSFSRAGNASCLFCGTVADIDHVKQEGWAGRMKSQLMAVVCNERTSKGRRYLSGTEYEKFIPADERLKEIIDDLTRGGVLSVPNEQIAGFSETSSSNSLGITVRPYGLRRFSDLFSLRQLVCLLSFAKIVNGSHKELISNIDAERAKALLTCVALVLDRLADWNSSLCSWSPESTGGAKIGHTFGRQIITMVWDYAESAVWGDATGSVAKCLDWVVKGLIEAESVGSPANTTRGSAMSLGWRDQAFDAVVTDPPYYDNVPYSDIADFFYVWLKRSVGFLHGEHFAGSLTPKKQEAIADANRHGGSWEAARAAYEEMMGISLREVQRVLKREGDLVIVYAHKTTLGWTTLIEALRSAEFMVVEAWPLDTEMSVRLRAMNSSALASSIFLVARKRLGKTNGNYEEEVRGELDAIVRERVGTLWEMGISGADLVIACVGAGLRAFTRFARVEYANGEEVPAERFLTEVETVVLDTILQKLSKAAGGNGSRSRSLAGLDSATRFYVLWRYTYGAVELDAGEAIIFANGTHVELDGPLGLSSGSRALVEKKKGKYKLRDFAERGDDDDLGLPDKDTGESRPTVDVLHRLLWLLEKRPPLIPEFIADAQPNLDQLRLVAQALAGPALKGGELENISPTAEQSALGKLLANWSTVMEGKAAREDRRVGQQSLGI
jgi:putative DNA methylase